MNNSGTDLESLFNRLADGIGSEADEQRLAELLRADPQTRRAYREFMALHSALHWDYVANALPELPEPPAPVVSVPNARLGWPSAALIAVAVAATIAVVAVLRPFASTTANKPEPASVALLVDGVGPQFAEGRAPDGVRFGPGEYELLEGTVHVRFAHGADVIVASPARFDITDAQHIRLVYGKIRVTAPPAAKGFTVATHEAAYVDLGTEFGLSVDGRSKSSDLYVFDGQVNVADSQSGKVLSEVVEGESSRYIDGAIAEAPELKGNEFPTPGAIGLQRWQRYAEQIRESPGLLAFYPFHKAADETKLLNHKVGGAAGRIAGARWVSGRWPGKESLLFDRDTDYAEIEIPGEHDALTIATWINVDRLDFELNAILNSDGYDVGEFHFQLTRQGLPRGGVIVEGSFKEQVLGNAVPLGQWAHVAMVISNGARTTRIYVNGALARERQYPHVEVLRPGLCRIGNWLPNADSNMALRALRGRMDELAIWDRALPEAEITRLVEAGRPALLWNKH